MNMATPPPRGFVTIEQAMSSPNKAVNIMGVVVELPYVSKTSGTDFMSSFGICDSSTTLSSTGIKVRFFKPNRDELPSINAIGDVVILRGIKIQDKYGSIALASWKTQTIVIAEASIPAITFKEQLASGYKFLCSSLPSNLEPTSSEQFYAIDLHELACKQLQISSHRTDDSNIPKSSLNTSLARSNSSQTRSGTTNLRSTQRKRLALLQELRVDQYCDLVVEVAKMFSSFNCVELYATDYTENTLLFNYLAPTENTAIDLGLSTGWQGPFGQHTITVTLWPPHSDWASSNIKVGDVVYLRNIHTKFSRADKLEGQMHPDYKYPNQVDIRKISDAENPQLQALLQRKSLYEQRYSTRAHEAEGKLERQSRRVKRKGQKEKEQRERSLAELKFKQKTVSPTVNPHVRCSYLQRPITPIADIIGNAHRMITTPEGVKYELPFINAKYRARVRVVDFYPRNLEDFVHSLEDESYNPKSKDLSRERSEEFQSSIESENGKTREQWEWAFWLCVEDASARTPGSTPVRMSILVAVDGAEGLLRMTATDLRKDHLALAALKEKLFILWGDLQELKEEDPTLEVDDLSKKASSVPFECCVEEYGVKIEGFNPSKDEGLGWDRMHRIVGATVML